MHEFNERKKGSHYECTNYGPFYLYSIGFLRGPITGIEVNGLVPEEACELADQKRGFICFTLIFRIKPQGLVIIIKA